MKKTDRKPRKTTTAEFANIPADSKFPQIVLPTPPGTTNFTQLGNVPCSWTGENAHVLCPNGNVKRCVIGELNFQCGVFAKVRIFTGGKFHETLCSPQIIASSQFLWFENLLVSDISEEDNETSIAERPVLLNPLPELAIAEDWVSKLPYTMRKSWEIACRETNAMLKKRFLEEPVKTDKKN